MARTIVFLQGGGIGIDQELALRRILAAAAAPLELQAFPAGEAAVQRGLPPLPPPMLDAVRTHRFALKTKLLNAAADDQPNYNVQLRRALGLFASVRPLKSVAGLPARFASIDLILVREITEDLYAAIEHEVVPGVVQSIKVVTEAACRRFFRFTFDLARKRRRRRVHCIHKANILKLADGLFLDCFRQVAAEYPDIESGEMIVDNACMQLVRRPQQFDVLAAGNLYGDLLSDLGAGLIGGITSAVGVNRSDSIAVYEAIHGGPQEAVGGPDRANPLPLLFAALELLRDLGFEPIAARILAAVESVLQAGRPRTGDLGGNDSTTEMTDAILAALPAAAPA